MLRVSAGTSNVDDAVDKRKSIYSLDKDGFIGFNPIVKRTCAAVTAKETQLTYSLHPVTLHIPEEERSLLMAWLVRLVTLFVCRSRRLMLEGMGCPGHFGRGWHQVVLLQRNGGCDLEDQP